MHLTSPYPEWRHLKTFWLGFLAGSILCLYREGIGQLTNRECRGWVGVWDPIHLPDLAAFTHFPEVLIEPYLITCGSQSNASASSSLPKALVGKRRRLKTHPDFG